MNMTPNPPMTEGEALAVAQEAYDAARVGGNHEDDALTFAVRALTAAQPQLEGGGEVVAWMTPESIAHLAKQNGVAKVDAWNCASGAERVPVYTATPSAPVGVEVAVARLAFNEYPRWWVGLKAGQRKLFGREPARWAEEAFKAGARAALAQQPAQAAPGDVPPGMIERIESAARRIENGHAPRRIPADPSDVDLVLAEVLSWIKGEPAPFWVPTPPGDDAAGGG